MTKLPEPEGYLFDPDTASYNEPAYTKAQMLQFRRDVLEEAAIEFEQCSTHSGENISAAIRKLKDET